MSRMKWLVLFLMVGFILQGCSIARFQPVQRDSIYVTRVDSVMVFDSVYVDRIRTIREKADTVYITDYKTEYKYKYLDRVKIDTCFVDKTVTETVEVEKKLTWWQELRLKGFWWLAGIVVAYVLWKILKLKLSL